MNSRRKSKQRDNTDISVLYSLKLSALWGALKRQHVSFWFLCLYFFFEYVRPQTLYPIIDFLPWSQITLLATLLTVITNKSAKWTSGPINKLFFLFCLVVILSGIFGFMPSHSWSERNIMLSWFLVYFLTIAIVNTEERLFLFLLAYMLFSLKMAQHGALNWADRGFSFASYGLIGAPGWFRNSGEYAIQMLIFGSLSIFSVLALKKYWGRYKKWLLIAASITGYMAVMGASSRGAQISLAVMMVWWVLKLKGGIKALFAASVIALTLYNLLPDEQIQRLNEMGSDETSLQRLAYWEYGLKHVIPENPVLGVGYKNWMPYVTYKKPEGMGPYGIVEEPHNIYIQAAAELGYTGLIIFLMLIFAAFAMNRQTRNVSRCINNIFLYNLSYGLDAGLVGFLVAGSFVTVLYYPFFWVQIAMIVAVNSVARNKLGVQEGRARQHHKRRMKMERKSAESSHAQGTRRL